MSSKFFTWTKGDRSRNAPESMYSGGVVPIPVECILIKGFDYSQTPKKNHRRPLPLRLEPSPEVASPYDEQTDDQATLQDAAVKSATSLIAVVNDMLRSPLASARLPPSSSTLAPGHGRPRSRTAPSTPLVEAPTYPLAELPGSTPERPRASYHHSYDSKLRQSKRPYSHARRPSHPWLHLPGDVPTGNHEKSTPSQQSQPATARQQQSEALTSNTYRSSKPVLQPRRIWSDPMPSHGNLRPLPSPPQRETSMNYCVANPSTTPSTAVDTHRASYDASNHSDWHDSQPAHASSLQASHEAHLAALTEAHRREIASLHVYIAQIEPARRGLLRTSEVHTHPSTRQYARAHQADAWRPPLSGHRTSLSQSNTTNHTTNATDRHCTSLAGCGEIWLECNHLRNSLETTNTRLSQSEDTVHRLQALEKSLKATIEELRARLLAANNERLDVQEGLHDACCRVRGLAEREANLVLELEELQKSSSTPSAASSSIEEENAYFEPQEYQHQPTPSPSTHSSPSLSPSQTRTPSPSALGISLPQTPLTIASATAEALLVTTSSPNAYTHPRTPPAGSRKETPLPLPLHISSPTPMRLRRGETVKSVGEAIVEMYAGENGGGIGWEAGWDGEDEVVEWV